MWCLGVNLIFYGWILLILYSIHLVSLYSNSSFNCISWNFLNNSTANYFNLSQNSDDTYVRDFLENDSQRVLSASLNDTRKSIQFQNKIPNEYQNVLLFYKTSQKRDVNANSFGQKSDLGMLTLEGGIVKSIYNSLTSIFVPSAINVSFVLVIILFGFFQFITKFWFLWIK